MKDLPENIDSKYRFITIAAKRCELLQKGATPKVDKDKYNKYTTMAMDEAIQGLVEFEIIEEEKPEKEKAEGEQ